MNIFVLDTDPELCAQYHCDKHVVKMILESAQLMCTTTNIVNNIQTKYKSTHINHPCTIWTRSSLSNWLWLGSLSYYLNREFKYRFEHVGNHRSFDVILNIPYPNIPDIGLTPFLQTMPEYLKNNDPVVAYRNYYIKEKINILSYKKRRIPFWLLDHLEK